MLFLRGLGFIIEYIEEKKKIQVEPEIFEGIATFNRIKNLSFGCQIFQGKGKISKKWKINNNTGYLEI